MLKSFLRSGLHNTFGSTLQDMHVSKLGEEFCNVEQTELSFFFTIAVSLLVLILSVRDTDSDEFFMSAEEDF
jgi:hypothetical protein